MIEQHKVGKWFLVIDGQKRIGVYDAPSPTFPASVHPMKLVSIKEEKSFYKVVLFPLQIVLVTVIIAALCVFVPLGVLGLLCVWACFTHPKKEVSHVK